MTTKSLAMAAVLSLSLAAPVLAAEDVVEHDTYEKRSMKIENVPAVLTTTTLAPSRVYENHESESNTVERHTATPPAPVVKERTMETVETKEKN